jgi:hypothetical protein
MYLEEQVDLEVVSWLVVLAPMPEVSPISLSPILSQCEQVLSLGLSLSYADLVII